MPDPDVPKPDPDPAAALAERAGVDRTVVDELIDGGVLTPGPDGTFSEGDLRRVHLVHDLSRGGIPTNLLVEAVRRGTLNLGFVDQPVFDRFSAYEPETFEELSRRTGVPVDLLLVVREASGSPAATPAARVRTTELGVVGFLERALRYGVRPELLERTLRVAGDGARRLAETEADWWRSDILGPLIRQGVPQEEIGTRTAAFATEIGQRTDEVLLALYHGQQAHAWMRNIFDGLENVLAQAGLHQRLERLPAISFIDVTGYSRLTEERGDASAADLAGRVARLVQRVSADHGGRTVKWLGDGLMVYHPGATGAVDSALDLQELIALERLPPAHVGIHAGPVMFQEGDYFGRTVNAAARIAAHAGEARSSSASRSSPPRRRTPAPRSTRSAPLNSRASWNRSPCTQYGVPSDPRPRRHEGFTWRAEGTRRADQEPMP
jgi:adenylate cyclase